MIGGVFVRLTLEEPRVTVKLHQVEDLLLSSHKQILFGFFEAVLSRLTRLRVDVDGLRCSHAQVLLEDGACKGFARRLVFQAPVLFACYPEVDVLVAELLFQEFLRTKEKQNFIHSQILLMICYLEVQI